MIKIIELSTKKQLKQFIEFPNQLYKGNSFYVPPLYLSVEWMLSKKNPFFQHSQVALFLAIDENKVIGRIAAIYNKTHIDRYNDKTGFFGFFESVNTVDVAQKLFMAASDWLKRKGLTTMMGPANLTTNESCGILIEGFGQAPMALMPYNFEYYIDLYQSCGLEKVMDLFSYEINGNAIEEKYGNVLKKSMASLDKNKIIIRPISSKNFDKDIANLMPVYNKCNENNWGFMPLNTDEFKAMAKDLKMITSLDLALVVEKDNCIIGFIIAIPNINQSLKHVKNGKLFPLGLLKLLWYKRKINNARVLILGVLGEHSGLGLDLVLYQRIKEALNLHSIYQSEACYVMENNYQMNSILKKIGGKCVKKYRMYQMKY